MELGKYKCEVCPYKTNIWIPVDQEAPSESGCYLATYSFIEDIGESKKRVHELWFSTKTGWRVSEECVDEANGGFFWPIEVYAWMPLPGIYEEE